MAEFQQDDTTVEMVDDGEEVSSPTSPDEQLKHDAAKHDHLLVSGAGAGPGDGSGAVSGTGNGNGQQQSPMGSKERHSLTLEQRRALRRWANSQMVRPSHRSCIEWFASQYGLTISQSTVSHSLSTKYARLDGDPQLSGSRLRFGNWPDVEKLVLLWHTETVSHGRHPTNEELADKAKAIFTQLPRYKGEAPPEFSPGWIHRFKKRYGLLMRRQRRTGSSAAVDTANDFPYLVELVPHLMSVASDTSPGVIHDAIERAVGIDVSLAMCARVRDEILRTALAPAPGPAQPHIAIAAAAVHAAAAGTPVTVADDVVAAAQPLPPPPPPPPPPQAQPPPPQSHEDDAEIALQNALRAIQQEEIEAEAAAAAAAAAREDRERLEQGLQSLPPRSAGVGGGGGGAGPSPVSASAAAYLPAHPQQTPNNTGGVGVGVGVLGTPTPSRMHHQHQPSPAAVAAGQYRGPGVADDEQLKLTPIPSQTHIPAAGAERPVRCPFCVNARLLRSIKESVEHLSTHVVV